MLRFAPAGALRRQSYVVRPVPLATARALVARFHYAGGAANTCVYAHGLFWRPDPYTCLGAALWLPPIRAAALAIARGEGCPPERVLMLSRSVLAPAAPPNAASFLIGASIRAIRAGGRFDALVTYADEYASRWRDPARVGTIYRASNWSDLGWSRPRHVWVDAATGRQLSVKAGPRTRNAAAMRALGARDAGLHRLRRFVFDLQGRRPHPRPSSSSFSQPALLAG